MSDTTFVPASLDASRWSTLEPLYQELLAREPANTAELERLLLDRSELDSGALELQACDRAWELQVPA